MGVADWYWEQLRALLPLGAAWPQRLEARLHQLLRAEADELARIHERAQVLIEEVDPRTTYELLTDWERVAGLPDPCLGLAPTLSRRRESLVAKLTRRGGQSRQYFIDVAASIGFAIAITEFEPWRCDMACDLPITGDAWSFAWEVRAPEETVRFFTTQSGCDEPLSEWGNDVLECVIGRLAPAHTVVIFAYGG